MKYIDLKKFLGSLTPAQLEQEVIISTELEYRLDAVSGEVLDEDWWNPSGDGLERVSSYDAYKGTSDYPEGEPIRLHKGEVVIWSDVPLANQNNT